MKKTHVEEHFDKVAPLYDLGKVKYSFYYSNLKKLLLSLIGRNKTVLEFGCGTGDLLSSLNPKVGYGMDVSQEMIKIAKIKYKDNKNLIFSTVLPDRKFDYIFLSDVVEHLEKPKETFMQLSKLMNEKSKLIVTMANPIWEPLLMVWENMGLKMKEGPHKRYGYNDLRLMVHGSGMRITKHDYYLLVPVKIPIITILANKYLEKYLKRLAFIEYFSSSKAL